MNKALEINSNKAVLLSIKKQWLEKILSGEKTIEVRKTMPWEISYPFVVFCYETKANGGAGKVTAAFVCRDINTLDCLRELPAYDFMSGVATLKSVTELRTHWDGMVAQGIQPVSAVMFCNKRGPMLKHTCDEMNTLVQAMNDEDFYMTLEAAGGDASKMPHYNFDVILDQNIPVKK